jgi:hypothetical protein
VRLPLGRLPGRPHETWRALGGFAEHYFMFHEDFDLSHRLRLAGAPFGVLPAAQVVHEYSFAKGATKWRRLEANRWKTVLRTYPAPPLALVAPILLVVELPLVGVAAAGGWLGPSCMRGWTSSPGCRAPGASAGRFRAFASWNADTFAAGLVSRLDSPFLGASEARARTR